jgi:serine/threonine protein kinase
VTADSSPGNWSEITSLIDALLDAAPERRAALIEELSAGDEVRRSELERLLAECELESPLFSRPAAERFAALFGDDVAHFPEALTERYRLTTQLGRGGMATVYLARDLKHARDVAVKVMHPFVASALGADLFLREIEIVAQLHHPHIVPLFDSGEADGSLYYVMPYEEGSSLRRRLAQDGLLPLEDAVLILRDVCDALAYAHQHGVVHRDIKPDNVLLSGRHAMVTDFGVAKAATDAAGIARVTGAGVALGTPLYMAPEQRKADPGIDHRADIYSFGILAYELLAGRPPFTDEGQLYWLAHLTAVPAPLTKYRPDLPSPLVELVMKSLEKNPADRWQSADEMVQRLEAIASVMSGPAPVPDSRSPWKRRAA